MIKGIESFHIPINSSAVLGYSRSRTIDGVSGKALALKELFEPWLQEVVHFTSGLPGGPTYHREKAFGMFGPRIPVFSPFGEILAYRGDKLSRKDCYPRVPELSRRDLLLRDFLFNSLWEDYSVFSWRQKPPGAADNPFRWGLKKEHLGPFDRIFQIANAEDISYPVELDLVMEQGYKARSITIPPLSITLVLHLVRTFMHDLFKVDAECATLNKIGKKGRSAGLLDRVSEALKRKKTPVQFLSLDLTSATDTFNTELVGAIQEGIIGGYVEDHPQASFLWVLLPLISAHPEVSYRRFMKTCPLLEPTVKAKRGIMMGNPASWPLLNLYLRFFSERSYCSSWEHFSNRVNKWLKEPRDSKFPHDNPNLSRCGDDQSELGHPNRFRKFEKLLVEEGSAIISKGAHFQSKHSIVFTENLYKADRENGIDYVDILRIKNLLISAGSSRLPGLKEVPPTYSIGSSITTALEWWGDEVKHGVLAWAHRVYQPFLDTLKSAAIPIYLPRDLGGYGIAHPRGLEQRYTQSLYIRALKVVFRGDYSWKDLWELSLAASAWNPVSHSKLGREVTRRTLVFLSSIESQNIYGLCDSLNREHPKYLDFWGLELLRKDIAPGWVDFSTVISETSGALYAVLKGWFDGPTLQDAPSVYKVARLIRRSYERILEGRSAHGYQPLRCTEPNGKVIAWFQLRKRLDWRKKCVLFRKEEVDRFVKNLTYPLIQPPLELDQGLSSAQRQLAAMQARLRGSGAKMPFPP
jgi:hypothetical protein